MIKIGLTGGIGTGKSAVSSFLAQEMRMPVFDADACVHALSKTPGIQMELAKLFPEAFAGGAYNPSTVRDIVFADPEKMAALHALYHPRVGAALDAFLAQAERDGAAMALADIPLLFEAGLAGKFDYTLCTDTSEAIQRERVLRRPNMNAQRLEANLAAVWKRAARLEHADYIIDTSATVDGTQQQVRDAIGKIERRHAYEIFKKKQNRPISALLDKTARPPIVWVIGNSRSGKTAIAEDGVGPLGFAMVGSSEAFRTYFPRTEYAYDRPDRDRAEGIRQFVHDVSQFSASRLTRDAHFNLDYLTYNALRALEGRDKTGIVLEGMRNPYEFTAMFMPGHDMAILLDRAVVEKYDTGPEKGIDVIETNLRWMIEMGMVRPQDAIKIDFQDGGYALRQMARDRPGDRLILTSDARFTSDYELIDDLKLRVNRLVAARYDLPGTDASAINQPALRKNPLFRPNI